MIGETGGSAEAEAARLRTDAAMAHAGIVVANSPAGAGRGGAEGDRVKHGVGRCSPRLSHARQRRAEPRPTEDRR